MTLHRMRLLLALPILLIAISSSAQEVISHRIFNSKDGKTSERKMLREMAKADVVLFGEQHNSTLAHWLQLKAVKHLHTSGGVTIGMEMMEADDQQHLEAFLSGKIDAKALDTLARLWNNHATDYSPIVDFAQANGIRVVASNIPRRYASMVYKKGFGALDTLSEEEKAWMAPLPIAYDPELPGYKAMLEMMGGHGGETLPMAQAVKDATMAHFIIENLENGKTFLHLNGAYHSDRYEGILWYLRRKRPELRYLTISTVTQTELRKLEQEHRGKADFIICVDEDFPVSYR
jgi:uncharacterized iron-regulated protein